MVVAPCSIRTMSSIAAGISSNLLLRAADVTLKERRKLILMVRETPFHLGHLRSMVALTEMGAIIAPPIPGFYHKPQSILELVDHSVDRVLDLLGAARRGCPALGCPAGSRPRTTLKENEMKRTVLRAAFQGEQGAFSQEAIRRLLGDRR